MAGTQNPYFLQILILNQDKDDWILNLTSTTKY